jgi:hypothetical protein
VRSKPRLLALVSGDAGDGGDGDGESQD